MKQLLIIARGCPAHALGAYGNEWIITPTLDGLAARGTAYDRHYATNPRTLPPLMSGPKWLVIHHHNHTDAAPQSYDSSTKVFDFADRSHAIRQFSEAGFGTLILDSDDLLPPWNISDDLFAAYCEDLLEDADDTSPIEPWLDPPTGWFDSTDAESWELLHRTFAAAVTQFDTKIGKFIEEIPDLDSITIGFTSDFGYPLGEHGLLGPYRPWCHEEYVHLPMIVAKSTDANAGRRVWNFTTPEDVPSLLNGHSPQQRDHVVTFDEVNGFREAAIRTDDFVLLLPLKSDHLDDESRDVKLYTKPNDRWERDDVRIPQLAMADELEARLRDHLATLEPT
jgi:arylsulfatase A-like enzyme